MAVYPLPAVPFASRRADLVRVVATTPFRDGGGQVVELGTARWRIELTTNGLKEREFGLVEAWWDRLRGGLNGFYGTDPGRPYPIDYGAGLLSLTRAAGGAFDGTATVTGLGAYTISLATLPAGLTLKPGDYVGLIEGDLRGLYRLVTAVTANGSGAVTVTVEPEVLTNLFTTAATANLAQPVCVMQPDLSVWRAARTGMRSPITFGGVQRVI